MIYLDHAATTPVRPEVFDAMRPYFLERFGNPSSLHSYGLDARVGVERARQQIASAIGADPQEIIFTSGGTESDNLALRGVLQRGGKKDHIITSAIEHPAVLETCKFIERLGHEVTYLSVDREGRINPAEVEDAIQENTRLISIMHANNEIGSIQPIAEVGAIAAAHGIYMHTDAVQSVGKIPVNVKKLNVQMLSISSHKIYGPKGVGCLYVQKGTKLTPLVFGGGHERGLRSGTENVSGIVGFGEAMRLAIEDFTDNARIQKLRDALIDAVLREIPSTQLNGGREHRLPNNANFSFSYIEGESLLLRLNAKGIAGSTGSACSSKKLEPSHVLLAIGLSPVDAHGSLRLTLGRETTNADVRYVLEVLPGIVNELRQMSPLSACTDDAYGKPD
ncbi:MAG: cysteine desulfurase NifS [Euryarchaeota archaeon]|nr:cysteine desulfurase NifS [Euryarchaeota archaeon]